MLQKLLELFVLLAALDVKGEGQVIKCILSQVLVVQLHVVKQVLLVAEIKIFAQVIVGLEVDWVDQFGYDAGLFDMVGRFVVLEIVGDKWLVGVHLDLGAVEQDDLLVVSFVHNLLEVVVLPSDVGDSGHVLLLLLQSVVLAHASFFVLVRLLLPDLGHGTIILLTLR